MGRGGSRRRRRRLVATACRLPRACTLAGIATVEGLMYATAKEVGAIKGISEQKVAKLKEIGGCCRGPACRRALPAWCRGYVPPPALRGGCCCLGPR